MSEGVQDANKATLENSLSQHCLHVFVFVFFFLDFLISLLITQETDFRLKCSQTTASLQGILTTVSLSASMLAKQSAVEISN